MNVTDGKLIRLMVDDEQGVTRTVLLYREPLEVTVGQPVVRAVVPVKPLLPPRQQPPGYAPRPHGADE